MTLHASLPKTAYSIAKPRTIARATYTYVPCSLWPLGGVGALGPATEGTHCCVRMMKRDCSVAGKSILPAAPVWYLHYVAPFAAVTSSSAKGVLPGGLRPHVQHRDPRSPPPLPGHHQPAPLAPVGLQAVWGVELNDAAEVAVVWSAAPVRPGRQVVAVAVAAAAAVATAAEVEGCAIVQVCWRRASVSPARMVRGATG